MTSPPAAPFMRHTPPDPALHQRQIAQTQARLQAAQASQDRAAVLDAVADLGGLLTSARAVDEALTLLRAHEPLADAHAHLEQAAWFYNAMGTALQYQDQRDAAEPCFARAVALARAQGWMRIEAMALHHWGRSLVEQGRLGQAVARFGEALALRERTGDARQASSREALAAIGRLQAGDTP